MRTAPSGRPSLEEEAVSGSRGTHKPDPATARLTGWITPVVDGAGYDLEELVVTPAGRRSVVRVVVDREGGVTLDDIAEISRTVSEVLDANDDGMGRTPYVLEVSSPGVDRPLTGPRHWRRNTGRLVTVAVGPAGQTTEVTGRVTAVDDAGVTLAVEAQGKPGAKKRPPTPRQVPWAELGNGRVQVEFGRPGADDLPGDDLTDDEPTDDEPTDDTAFADDDIEPGGIPQARGGAQ
jgi:ribosome maturation factor RimP